MTLNGPPIKLETQVTLRRHGTKVDARVVEITHDGFRAQIEDFPDLDLPEHDDLKVGQVVACAEKHIWSYVA
jgi:hypothetical protein